MNSIKHRFTLDMHSVQSQISIPASIYDTARTLYINFSDGGDPYSISEGCTALLFISKPSGAKLYEWCAIKDNTNVVYPFSQNKSTASEEGICECEITLYSAPDEDGETEQIASPRFSIVVSERAINRGDDEILPEASIGFIDQAVKDELVRRQKEEGRVAAENARVSAETARAGAETDRANAESARATAETERASAESARKTAESARKTAENARASAETARASAEGQRIANEEERQRNSAEYKAQVDLVREEISTWQDEWGKISSFDKRIENLEAAVSPGLVTPTIDDTIAYRKTVPNGVFPNAAVCEVGGMSYKCENLLDMSALDSKTISGVTFTKNSNGTYTASGTSTAAISVALHSIGIANTEKMWLSGGTRSVMLTANAMLNNAFVQSLVTVQGTTSAVPQNITYDKIALYLVINKGVTLTNETFYGMLNKGTTALPYQPYFTGLRDSKVTEVASVGTNLFDPQKIIDAGGTETNGEYIISATAFYDFWRGKNVTSVPPKKGTRYIVGFEGRNDQTADKAATTIFFINYTDGSTSTLVYVSTNKWNYQYAISTAGKDVSQIGVTYSYSGKTYLRNVFIAEYTGDNSYTPYFRESLPIPADALDGFGQGVNAQCYNKIVLDPLEGVKKYVKKVGVLDMGLQGWQYSSADKRFFIQDARMAKASNSEAMNALCAGYTPISFNDFYADSTRDKTISRTGDYLFVRNLSYTSAAAFKTAMSGVVLLYELATPTETDVSTLFADDNLLPVEAGGTITAVNEYEQAVPFSIEYTVKGA